MNPIIINYLEGQITNCTLDAKEMYENYQYHNKDEGRRNQLFVTLQYRSAYKRALKQYVNQCKKLGISK